MSSTPEVSEESKSEDGSIVDASEVSSVGDTDEISSLTGSEISTSSTAATPQPSIVADDGDVEDPFELPTDEDDVVYERENIKVPSPEGSPSDIPPSEVIAAVVSEDEGGEDTDTDDEDIYQKLEGDISSTLLIEKHPGITQSSYPEILTLTKVIRNDKGEVVDDLHKTFPFVTKYERAKIIGVRTKQLNHGADSFIDVPPDMIDGYSIALKEMEAKKLPYIVARPLPNGGSEYWRLSDLEIIHY